MQRLAMGLLAGAAALSSMSAVAAPMYNPDQTLTIDYNITDEVSLSEVSSAADADGYYHWELFVDVLQDVTRVDYLVDMAEDAATFVTLELWDSFDYDTLTGTNLLDTVTLAAADLGVEQHYYGVVAGSYDLHMFSDGRIATMEVSAVPIPAAALLFGTALLGFAGFGARRKV